MRLLLCAFGLLLGLTAATAAAVRFPAASCWARRPNPGYAPIRPPRGAPSVVVPAPRTEVDPAALVQRTLRGFGDRSIIRGARLGEVPAVMREHRRGWFGLAPQPRHPLWVYLDAPVLKQGGGQAPAAVVRATREQWEVALLAGALRDEACEARTDPIVGASVGSTPELMSFLSSGPFGQRFPSPSEDAVRRRAAALARDHGARLASMWFLHALQPAPVVVFETADKTRFIDEFADLDRQLALRGRYEGYFVVAVDMHHVPFMLTWSVARGEVGGGEWSSDRCHYPFPTSGPPIGTKNGCNG